MISLLKKWNKSWIAKHLIEYNIQKIIIWNLRISQNGLILHEIVIEKRTIVLPFF